MERPALTIGRYVLHRQIARGGMATIHIARLMGDEGFSRIVAAKRLLPEFAEDPDFVPMFLDEARIASKIRHRNVVPVLDLVTTDGAVLLVQEYVHGAPVHWLLNKARQDNTPVPLAIAVSIGCQVLAGLQAAHEMVDEMGTPLNVVHRDVSPQNVMIATDGTARLLDFGVAKASMAAHVTREGAYVGKLAYSAPEQLRGKATRQSDLYSLAVMLWEMIVGHRMHGAQGEAELVAAVMNGTLPTISGALAAAGRTFGAEAWLQLDAVERVVKRGLAVAPVDRWTTAVEMEQALTAAAAPASASEVATWLRTIGKDYLEKNDKLLAAEEASWRRSAPPLGRRTQAELRSAGDRTSVLATLEPSGPEPPSVVPTTWPAVPVARKISGIIAVLGLVIIALSLGLVLIVKSPSEAATSTRDAAPTRPPAVRTLPAAVIRPVFAPSATDQSPALDPAAITRSSPPRQPTRAPVRPAARGRQPPAKPKSPEPKPPPVAPPAAATVAPAPVAPPPEVASKCSPPYYFAGKKKIFKPACL